MPDLHLIHSVSNYLEGLEEMVVGTNFLFRGQDRIDPLLPKIARADPAKDTTKVEEVLLREFRRRTAQEHYAEFNDWDLLAYTQHYGMATRLLDWTTNPLIGLWFACSNSKHQGDSYVYLFMAEDEFHLDVKNEPSPFKIKKTKIFRPNINNPRIAAQNGWFTAHPYSKKSKKFVDLHKNSELKKKVLLKMVPKECRTSILESLDKLGINHESVFLGAEGTCKHLNWLNGFDK